MLFSTLSISRSRVSCCLLSGDVTLAGGTSLARGCRCPTGACLGGDTEEPTDPGELLDCANTASERTMLAVSTSAAIDARDAHMTDLLLMRFTFQRWMAGSRSRQVSGGVSVVPGCRGSSKSRQAPQ